MAVVLMLSIKAAPQSYYQNDNSEYENVSGNENPDDYTYDVEDGVDLTGDQWHTDDASILAANNSQYIVVRGPTRYRYSLGRLDIPAYERLWGYRVSSYRPYYYNGSLGWYVLAGLVNYFIYPDGRWCRLDYRPYYYPYRYHIAHCHRINFFDWHFWHGRSHHNYRGHCYYNNHRSSSHYGHYGSNYYRKSQARSGNNTRTTRSRNSINSSRSTSASRSTAVRSTNSSTHRSNGTYTTSSRRSSDYTKAPDNRKSPESGYSTRSRATSSRSSGYSGTSGNSSRSSYTRSSSGSSRSSYSRSSQSSRRSSGTSSRSSSSERSSNNRHRLKDY